MVRKIFCDVCGSEIPDARDIFARITYKAEVETRTKTGKISIRRVSRSADICSAKCYQAFNILGSEAIVAEKVMGSAEASQDEQEAYVCSICGKTFRSSAALKAHEKLAHK